MNTDVCKDCIHGETCNKDDKRIYCTLYDRSFDADAWCEQFEREHLEKKD